MAVPKKPSVRCLFVDDQPIQLALTIANLDLALDAWDRQLEVVEKFTEVETAINFIQRDERKLDVIVADILWPRDEARQSSRGFQVFQHAKTRRPTAVRVALSTGDLEHKRLEREAKKAGAQIFRFHGDDLPGEGGSGWLDLAKDIIAMLEGNQVAATLVPRPSSDDGPSFTPAPGDRVLIGHGHSRQWRELKDFLQDRLQLEYDEFDRVATAGIGTMDRLSEMLGAANIAFLVLTAEDERTDGAMQARQNVIHELGLCQGVLGIRRAIVLLEEGCEEFSNIRGLGQLRYPPDNIAAVFEEVRRVLEREGIL